MKSYSHKKEKSFKSQVTRSRALDHTQVMNAAREYPIKRFQRYRKEQNSYEDRIAAVHYIHEIPRGLEKVAGKFGAHLAF